MAAATFLATKLRPPQARPNPVTRQRLLARLDEDRPLTLIAAPAGFGKTTLLTQWLGQYPGSVAWLSLDPDDNDPARFWGYVVAALRKVEPTLGETALALRQSPQPALVAWLTRLINLIAEQPRSLALVLEDYHLISALPIHEAVTFLLDHLPDQMRIILTTRADPPLPLAGRRARGQLTEIRAADLRFTSNEAAAFLIQSLGSGLSAGTIAALEARTEGWIAGLQLAALSLQGRQGAPAFVETFSGSHRYIIDYLVAEVLARQPEPITTFLLQTAILERLNGSLCDAVLLEPDRAGSGQAMLEQLEQANLFLNPLDDDRQWYRYHSLFAETLRHQLQRRHAALVPALHRRASAWYAQHGLMRDAIHHALSAGDFEQAAGLMERAADSLVRQGEVVTLQRWVDALPQDIVHSHVEVSIWQGWLLFVAGKYEAAERLLEQVESRFGITQEAAEGARQQPGAGGAFDPAEIFGRVAAIRASIAIIQRDLPRTITLSRVALDFLPRENMARAYAAWHLGKAHWLGGELEAAGAALASAERVSWDVDHLYGVFLVTHDLAQVQMAQGRLRQADQTYRRAIERAARAGEPHPAFGPACVGRGQIEREWNHLEAAASLFQEGSLLCEQAGNTVAVLQATVGLALVRQAQGEAGSAGELMRLAQVLAGRPSLPPFSSAHAAACQAWLALLQGDETAAKAWARGSDLAVDQPLSHLREREYLTLVRVLIREGGFPEAQDWLAKLWRLAETQGRAGSEIEILILQAEVCQAAGDQARAAGRLARAISMARPQGYMRLFLDEGEPVARLLARLDGQPEDAAYRASLLALMGGARAGDAVGQAGSAPNAGQTASIDPLSERELAVLRLIVAGHSNQEIANRLVIAVSTVKWYANIIYGKLRVESRTKAIARARELNIV